MASCTFIHCGMGCLKGVRRSCISITLIELSLINQLICKGPIPAPDPLLTIACPHPNTTSSHHHCDFVVMSQHSDNVMEMLQRRYLWVLSTLPDVPDPLQCLHCVQRFVCVCCTSLDTPHPPNTK